MSMTNKVTRIIFICFWVIAGAGLTVLLVAAVNSRNNQVCTGYDITINGESKGTWFTDKNDIVDVLTDNRKRDIKNKNVSSFDLASVEKRLESQPWIKNADLYFDNTGLLKIKVEERRPVARIFNTSGESFYIDSTGQALPLSTKMSAKLPVFTGFPLNTRKWKTPADRKMVKQIRQVSMYLLTHPFWMAQVSQVDIMPSREFEIIPTIGNHIIEFGDGSDYEKKFNRLFVFYKQVLAKTGMEKYKRLKVQFDQEIIGVKDESRVNANPSGTRVKTDN